ncbi:MAG: FAD:protein FMN transferase [Pseudomonadota bacterium]
MKLISLRSLALVMVLALLTACTAKEKLYQEQSYVFGTLVEVSIYGEDETRARQLVAHIFADFDRLHVDLHPWKPGALSHINEALAQPGTRVTASPEMVAVVRDAARLSEQSGGLFNPAIGKLVKLWGFHSDEFQPQLPGARGIDKLVAAHPAMSDVVVEGNEIYGRNAVVQLDFGGYAKGYALDLAAQYLKGEGVRNALINIGGNIMALGRHGDRPWRVGIQHPRKSSAIATLELHDGEAIGTSGDYQRYFIYEGRRYSHLIDPRSGWPVQGVQAATVVVPAQPGAGVLSDAASKPIFISGVDGWREAARTMGVDMAMLIDDQAVVHVTEALQRRIQFLEQGMEVKTVP